MARALIDTPAKFSGIGEIQAIRRAARNKHDAELATKIYFLAAGSKTRTHAEIMAAFDRAIGMAQ